MSRSEQIGAGAWEAARLSEYSRSDYAGFLCSIVAGDKRLGGILLVRKREEICVGELLIPMEATGGSPLADVVRGNVAQFAAPDNHKAVAEELGLRFGAHYGYLLVSYLGGTTDRLGVGRSLTLSNRFSRRAPRAPEPGDTGVAMGLAQQIMDSLPGGWQITPKPVISR